MRGAVYDQRLRNGFHDARLRLDRLRRRTCVLGKMARAVAPGDGEAPKPTLNNRAAHHRPCSPWRCLHAVQQPFLSHLSISAKSGSLASRGGSCSASTGGAGPPPPSRAPPSPQAPRSPCAAMLSGDWYTKNPSSVAALLQSASSRQSCASAQPRGPRKVRLPCAAPTPSLAGRDGAVARSSRPDGWPDCNVNCKGAGGRGGQQTGVSQFYAPGIVAASAAYVPCAPAAHRDVSAYGRRIARRGYPAEPVKGRGGQVTHEIRGFPRREFPCKAEQSC